jgi:glycosyltransferase involved in cell wall biosynthesis
MTKLDGTLVIHASNIHQGGGEKLLNALLPLVDPQYTSILVVDERMSLPAPLPPNIHVRRVKKSILGRLAAEWWLYRHAGKNDRVLCFGNLPPLFRLKAFTSVFVQNRYLVDGVGLHDLKPWLRLRITLERFWLRFSMRNADKFLVQTPSMLHLMRVITPDVVPIDLTPFAESAPKVNRPQGDERQGLLPTFLYVASGEAHKNHRRLIQAWSLLATEGVRPQLLLTLNTASFPELCAWIADQSREYGLQIQNLGTIDAAAMAAAYVRTDALIYPSLLESFGLPLIEASVAGVPIIAAELDYVRDVVSPVQTFDPASAISIARAVKRFCGFMSDEIRIDGPAEFLATVMRGKDR